MTQSLSFLIDSLSLSPSDAKVKRGVSAHVSNRPLPSPLFILQMLLRVIQMFQSRNPIEGEAGLRG